ncbi:MAG: bifunctional 4-hydroxy-3-methylbut-2-enyl diphosphate reductase/30S ribosomal protein S1 [Clostridiales Family XIII bacterium]|nr:bifunctional 4-hydroxy-3-methylbut-2-enyl diphosphate reductase/30S ribosomal protein S1 [Clostridiales Family XIII bacterium]
MTARPPRILLAEHAGCCFGVKRTLALSEGALRDAGARGVYACGPLIHNGSVMRELGRRGLRFIESPREAAPGGLLLVRSHGEGRAFHLEAAERGLAIIDATCPFVKRIHGLVRAAHARGRTVVIIGDARHPEVVGINGWCDNEALIVKNADEASRIGGDALFAVAQTTTVPADFDAIAACLARPGRTLELRNTICDATFKRQDACRKIAGEADAMLVIGDKSSANTQKLFEIARMACRNSHFIENISDLPLKALRKCNTIGVTAGASTPVRMIKEVIANMTTVNTESIENTEKTMEDFMEEIEKSLRLPRTGEIVTGTVIQVSNREVIINLGCKKDGVIPKDEIALEPDHTLIDMFKEGDEVQAKVLKTDDGDGNILLSKKKVVINEHWEDIHRAMEEKSTLDVKVVKEVNGGVIAVFKEIYGFIPLSQLSDRFVEKADEFIGRTLTVRVTRLDQRKNKVVFSHKAVLAEARQKRLQEIWESIDIGEVIEGTVMRFTDYGAFVDIGGIDGLLHISEISWGKLKHPQEVLKIGQRIPVMILSIVREKEKISLGYKQNCPEPWSVIDEKYHVGQIIHGKAVQIKDYGVFVELEPGLDGLVHISEIAFKRVTNIADELSVGQVVAAKILEIDRHRKRISLSIKETLERSFENGGIRGPRAGAAASEAAARADDVVFDEGAFEDEVIEADADEIEAAALADDTVFGDVAFADEVIEADADEAEAAAAAGDEAEAAEARAAAEGEAAEARAAAEAEATEARADAEDDAEEARADAEAAMAVFAPTGDADEVEADAPAGDADEVEADAPAGDAAEVEADAPAGDADADDSVARDEA